MKEERQISKHEAEQWSKDHGGIGYFETSAKTADNVEKLFFFAANEIIKRSQHLEYVGIHICLTGLNIWSIVIL